jgi:hypothetical protein
MVRDAAKTIVYETGAELGGGRRGFILGRTILEDIIFVIINN